MSNSLLTTLLKADVEIGATEAIGTYYLNENGVLVPYPALAFDDGAGHAIPAVTLTDQLGNAVSVSGGSGGGYPVSQSTNLTSVAAATSSTQLLAANTARKAFSIFNDSSATLYLAAANAASTSAYSLQIPAGELYESSLDYQGPLYAVWATAAGAARITEYV